MKDFYRNIIKYGSAGGVEYTEEEANVIEKVSESFNELIKEYDLGTII